MIPNPSHGPQPERFTGVGAPSRVSGAVPGEWLLEAAVPTAALVEGDVLVALAVVAGGEEEGEGPGEFGEGEAVPLMGGVLLWVDSVGEGEGEERHDAGAGRVASLVVASLVLWADLIGEDHAVEGEDKGVMEDGSF
mmetsp:Transcript_39276/g.111189  ORF Transcript_39276/g.111189 Transcript_39276/m.111189 type:complete len:137 (+) Transcript_39276:606-1016(+)